MEGCVNGAGRAGSDAGAEGGARLIAPPEGSGTMTAALAAADQ